jgi:predicted permease
MRIEQWFYQIPLRLRSLFSRQKVEHELDEELLYHLEELTQANLASGMHPKEARAAALRTMQGLEQHKEECRDVRGVAWLENLGRDLQYAMRMLRKSPTFTAAAILSLALGIGANTAIFSLIDTLLIRPLPVPHAERLRTIQLNTGRGKPQFSITYPLFQSLEDHNRAFASLFAWSGHSFQMRSGADMLHVDGVLASGDYFSTLGVSPIAGRTFTSADDHTTGGEEGPVAVISERFWDHHFQRHSSAIGRSLTLDRVAFTIIGVMPRSFFGADMDAQPDIWVPLTMASRVDDPACINSRSCWFLVTMGRLKDGVTAEQGNAALQVATPSILRESVPAWGEVNKKRFLSWKIGTSSGAQGWSSLRLQFRSPLAILMTLVGLVLLIACANMANLLLARAMARHREIGVRLALGAGRGRVIRQLLTESALLSLLGGLAGTFFAIWLTRFLAAFLGKPGQFGPYQTLRLDIRPDWRVVLFTLIIALATGMLFGLAPALQATRLGIGASLKESANNLRGNRRLTLGRVTLALQAAFSVLLVAAAGVFAGSLYRLLTLDVGFNPKNVVMISIDTDKLAAKDAALSNLYGQLLDRVSTLPGVNAASLIWIAPLGNGGWDDDVTAPGQPDVPEHDRDTCANAIGPGLFDGLGIPLLAGRQFNKGDSPASLKVGIISQFAAGRFFPNTNAVGRDIKFEGSLLRIVGIAGDIKYWNLRDTVQPELYIPYTQKQGAIPSLTFAIKTDLKVDTLYSEFRAALHTVAPDAPVSRIRTMQEQVADSVGRERMMASLSIFFGLVALLLTAIGLHGILAYAVTRRTGEIGIRMALGAQRRSVIWLIVSESVGFVAAGVAIGVVTALGLSRLAADLLYGIRPNDPGNLILAVVALLAVGTAAAAAPALRAVGLDPTQALREE